MKHLTLTAIVAGLLVAGLFAYMVQAQAQEKPFKATIYDQNATKVDQAYVLVWQGEKQQFVTIENVLANPDAYRLVDETEDWAYQEDEGN